MQTNSDLPKLDLEGSRARGRFERVNILPLWPAQNNAHNKKVPALPCGVSTTIIKDDDRNP